MARPVTDNVTVRASGWAVSTRPKRGDRSRAAGERGRLVDEPLKFAGYDHRLVVAHEFEWYRACTALYRTPGDTTGFEDIVGFPPGSGWEPPMVVYPTNLPVFPTGLHLEGDAVHLSLTHVPGFTDPPYWKGFERPASWPSWPGSVALRVLPDRPHKSSD